MHLCITYILKIRQFLLFWAYFINVGEKRRRRSSKREEEMPICRLDKFLLTDENCRQIIHLCCVWLSKTWAVEPSLLSARGPSGDKYFAFNHLVRTICQAFHLSACSQLVGSQRCQRARVKRALWKPVHDLGPSDMPKEKKKKKKVNKSALQIN